MISTAVDTQTYPLAPDALLPLRTKLNVLRVFHTGPALVREACGPVAMIKFRPRWLIPPLAVVTSPQGIRDVLGGSDEPVFGHRSEQESLWPKSSELLRLLF